MKIGVPTEMGGDEYRVPLTPAAVGELVRPGRDLPVQAGASEGSGLADRDYHGLGAPIVERADGVFEAAELIQGVRERQPHAAGSGIGRRFVAAEDIPGLLTAAA